MVDNYDDSFIGFAASRIGKGKQFFEKTSTTKAGKFYGSLADIKTQLIYLRSGKQINENEYQRLRSTLPEETKSPTDFKAKMENFNEVFNSILFSRQKAFGQAGFRNVPGQTQGFSPLPKSEGRFKIISVEGQ